MQTSVDQKLTAISNHLQAVKPDVQFLKTKSESLEQAVQKELAGLQGNMAQTDARLDQEVKDRTEKDTELETKIEELDAALTLSQISAKRKKTDQ